jgi:two-component system, sensor histidine kinase RegB
VMDRLGDPFVTTRRRGEALAERGGREVHGGMGLGFFIAKTLLERSGARVSLANKRQPEHGAIIRLDWPRDWLEHHDLMESQEIPNRTREDDHGRNPAADALEPSPGR